MGEQTELTLIPSPYNLKSLDTKYHPLFRRILAACTKKNMERADPAYPPDTCDSDLKEKYRTEEPRFDCYFFYYFVSAVPTHDKEKFRSQLFIKNYFSKSAWDKSKDDGFPDEDIAEYAFCLSAFVCQHDITNRLITYINYCRSKGADLFGLKGFEKTVEDLLEGNNTAFNRIKNYANIYPDKRIEKCKLFAKLTTLPEYDDVYKIASENASIQSTSNKNNQLSLSPLDHSSISLIGRNNEKNKLSDFLNSPLPFQMMFIVAPSGAGKTRLVTEWFRRHVDMKLWQAGFVEDDENLDQWKGWVDIPLENDTLIIVDYIYRFKEITNCITKKGARYAVENEKYYKMEGAKLPKLRLIVLEHVLPEFATFDVMDFNQQYAIGKSSRLKFSHKNSPLYLNRQDTLEHELMMKGIIKEVYSGEDDVLINKSYDILREMGFNGGSKNSNNDEIAFANFPLFAILIGHKLRQANFDELNDLNYLKRRDLIDFYFGIDKKYRIPWLADGERGHFIGISISVATILQYVSYDAIFSTLSSSMLKRDELLFWDESVENYMIATCNQITSSNNKKILCRYQPDIIGETFVLNFLSYFARQKEVIHLIYQIMLDEDKKGVQQPVYTGDVPVVYSRFIEFSKRLTLNLANDDFTNEKIERYWTAFINFLNPEHFLHQSQKVMVCLTIIEAVLILNNRNSKDKDFSALIIRFLDCVDVAFLVESLKLHRSKSSKFTIEEEGQWWRRLCLLTSLIDLKIQFGVFDKVDEDALNEVLQEFENTKSESSGLFIPIITDSKYVLDWIFRHTTNYKPNCVLDDYDRTPFLVACENGSYEVANYLLLKEVDTSTSLKNGLNALGLAVQNGHRNIIEILLERSSNERADIESTLLFACKNGFSKLFDKLLRMKNIVGSVSTILSQEALHIACHYGQENIVKQILSLPKIKVNQFNASNKTALMTACYQGHYAIVSLLLVRPDIQVNLKDSQGNTSLMMACHNRHSAIIRALVNTKKVCIHEQNVEGKSALSIAMKRCCEHSIAALFNKVYFVSGC